MYFSTGVKNRILARNSALELEPQRLQLGFERLQVFRIDP